MKTCSNMKAKAKLSTKLSKRNSIFFKFKDSLFFRVSEISDQGDLAQAEYARQVAVTAKVSF